MSDVRLIRRGANRRLFCYTKHGYTTLQEIQSWLAAGEDVRILDYHDQDITVQVLLKLAVEQYELGKLPVTEGQVLRLLFPIIPKS